ncbi:MAG: hypothetical protein AB1481_06050 [Candidatus Omnitrophota bacterium]
MKDNISPEEKLLRLIRGHKEHPVNAGDNKASSGPSALKTKKGMRLTFNFDFSRYAGLLSLKNTIGVAFIFSCIYLISSLVYPFLAPQEIRLTGREVKEEPFKKTLPQEEMKPLEFYLQGLEGKQIFSSLSQSSDNKGPLNVNTDLIKDINLVGIMLGDPAQAVIEDKKAQKTFYLTTGQFLGEFQVEEIQEGKVILNQNGQRFELYM